MKSKKVRNIKVISQSGRNYKPTPTVILKGQWMKWVLRLGIRLRLSANKENW